MFQNILSKENVSFKELEQICFKIACEFAKEMLRAMLEEYDKQLMNKRDKQLYSKKHTMDIYIKI